MSDSDPPKLYSHKPKKAQLKQFRGQPPLMGTQTAPPPPPPPPPPQPKEPFIRRYKFLWPMLLAVNLGLGIKPCPEDIRHVPEKCKKVYVEWRRHGIGSPVVRGSSIFRNHTIKPIRSRLESSCSDLTIGNQNPRRLRGRDGYAIIYLFTRTNTKKTDTEEEEKEATPISVKDTTKAPVAETSVSLPPTANPVIKREPIPENQQRELFKWILEEKRKIKPKNAEEKRKIDEEKALLKNLLQSKSIPSI
ncbi:mitochondrial rho GTPase [Trifolium pratense]|uniref:Mitochondrial rho GTPase n=1 Tax=Trifolium pratense TaxID=57577 RepID=A0A2K3PNZ4_TRIPR|nr:mitochondrial rho GTPase [Trifolium pratense]